MIYRCKVVGFAILKSIESIYLQWELTLKNTVGKVSFFILNSAFLPVYHQLELSKTMNKVIYCLLWHFSTVCKLAYNYYFLGNILPFLSQ